MARHWTTISVHADVHESLKAKKRDDETFNQVIKRLCELQDQNSI